MLVFEFEVMLADSYTFGLNVNPTGGNSVLLTTMVDIERFRFDDLLLIAALF